MDRYADALIARGPTFEGDEEWTGPRPGCCREITTTGSTSTAGDSAVDPSEPTNAGWPVNSATNGCFWRMMMFSGGPVR
jgi:hypothetical protein